MSSPSAPEFFTPRRPALVATLVFVAAALTLCWPMLSGQFLLGSDQYVAGYGFRLFGAEHFRAYGEIPQWNPYLFGGLPFMGAMHGDIFYPTAWLRWILPVDTAMNLGFAVHLVLAGITMYAFLRALGVTWSGALAGGLAYELSGIVASLVSPGHDGKLFTSAVTPLLFLAVFRLVRDQRLASGAGLLAFSVGLSLHGHPQLSYYLLVAGLLWGLYLVFLSPERPARNRVVVTTATAIAGVALGFGLYAIQALPFIEYIPFSPRGEGGASGGWEYATAFSMPVDELASLILPEFNGILDAYWGSNFFKLHTEYVGVLPLGLALLGMGGRRRSLVLALSGIAAVFLLVSFGGHTPFYRLWYEVMPMMKKVRAPGMAFFLVAFALAAFAGLGVERLQRGEVPPRRVLLISGVIVLVGLLGLAGVLQGVAQALAPEQTFDRVMANAEALRVGALRLTVLALAAGGVLWAMAAGRLEGAAAAAAIAALITLDLYSINRRFFPFQPPAAVTYRDDAITTRLRQTPLPYRTLDLGVYRGSWLMAHDVPTLLGYHGNEIRYFDELMGGKNQWQNLGSPALWDLYAVRYLITGQAVDAPGWRLVMGPVETTTGVPGYLYESEAAPAWARVVPAAAKVPEPQVVPTVIDPRFPATRIVLFPDTASVSPAALADSVPSGAGVPAEVRQWRAGAMTVALGAPAPAGSYLLVSENWYPDWTATVAGQSVRPLRGQHALLTVPLPEGAREVELRFQSEAYARGKAITMASLVLALGLLAAPAVRRRRDDG